MFHRDHTTPPADGSTVFVFGSNLAGRHGLGAALVARRLRGAPENCSFAMESQQYIDPTRDAPAARASMCWR